MTRVYHFKHEGVSYAYALHPEWCLLGEAYTLGKLPPRHPVPSIQAGAYVLASGISDTGLLVVWFADHEVIAI